MSRSTWSTSTPNLTTTPSPMGWTSPSTTSTSSGTSSACPQRGTSRHTPAVRSRTRVRLLRQAERMADDIHSTLFSDIYFSIIIRRKPLFYMVNLIIPCVGIFYLSILVFYLPAQVRKETSANSNWRWPFSSCFQSGEKTALVVAILISQTLYFNLIIEVIPATSVSLPILGK